MKGFVNSRSINKETNGLGHRGVVLVSRLLSFMLLSLMLVSCASKVQYGDAQAVETVNTDFGSTDLQSTAAKMVESLLTFPPVVEITQQGRPILFVDSVRNKTEEHIDTESVTDTIVNKLLRSGKFQFVDMTAVEAVQSQFGYQRNSGLVNPNKAAQLGRQVGAKYMIYGNLSSITKQNKKEKDVYYKFTLKMMGLESGLLVWQDEKEIRKSVRRSTFGF
ncbi:MAG: penicillin-binding protein activator LpoB [Pseudomonadales bacterium]|nr:penicillin-binding protein activator LpoB [Pseudomonadales bacterium]